LKKKVVTCYTQALTNDVSTSIMNLETANQIWDETSQILKKNHLQILCMLGQPNPSTVLQQTAPSGLQGMQIYMQTSETLLKLDIIHQIESESPLHHTI